MGANGGKEASARVPYNVTQWVVPQPGSIDATAQSVGVGITPTARWGGSMTYLGTTAETGLRPSVEAVDGLGGLPDGWTCAVLALAGGRISDVEDQSATDVWLLFLCPGNTQYGANGHSAVTRAGKDGSTGAAPIGK